MSGITFSWSGRKARSNLAKHGVSFDLAKTVFNDPFSLSLPDTDHSTLEERWIEIGLASDGRLLVVWYTEEASQVRMIGARVANKMERRAYERR